jgi:GT2 family glycosyltransferase
MTSCAIVILNFNGEKLLPQFLPSVIAHSAGADIIVADNGSTDGSVPLLKKSFPQAKLILLGKNLGFSGGYNKALSQIDADIVVLLNSDVEVTAGWLGSPLQLLESNPTIVAVQPKILDYKNRNRFEYAGAAGGFIDWLGYPFCRGRIFDTVETDEGQYNDQTEVFWASGASLFIRRDKYMAVGGLDESFFAHMEEIDLCWRLNRAGYSIFYDGTSTVFHFGGGTLTSGSPQKIYFNFKNGLAMMVKNMPARELLYKIPLRVVLDWTAAINFLLHAAGGSFLGVLKAHYYFVGCLRETLSERRRHAGIGFSVRPSLQFNKMIVVEYFLKGTKQFSGIKNPK